MIALNEAQQAFAKKILNPFMFRPFLFMKLPMGWLANLQVKSLSEEACTVTVPFKWLNQNPFRSTYFAVLAMAAEMSTGVLSLMAIEGEKPRISMLVVKLEAEFVKKATGITTFVCNDGQKILEAVKQAKESGEGVEFTAESIGKAKNGEVEAIFRITWSFKQSSKK